MSSDETNSTSIPPARILVVDDEPQIRRLLAISLKAQGYEVEAVETGQAGIEALATHGADLVVLDLGLPDRDGHEVLAEVRGWSEVPVIVLSVRSSEREKVAALDGGASDYVTKPFGIQELMARVRGLLRQRGSKKDAPPLFDDGCLRVDLARRLVVKDGEPVHFTRKEFALLAELVRHAGRVVTQQQLLRELWGPGHVEDSHYLRIVVAKIRQKLGENPAQPRYLVTEPGVGYRFRGDD